MKKGRLILIAGHNRASETHPRDCGYAFFNPHNSDTKDNEHWFMERLCVMADTILKNRGLKVTLLPFTLSLEEKIKWANENLTKYDIIVEVHGNAFNNPQANGTEVFYVSNGLRSYFYARKLSKIISSTIGTKNRGPKPSKSSHHGGLGIIDQTPSYDFLLELGFLSNNKDLEKVNKHGASAIFKTCKYLLERIS